jgi:SAM-dependent methyltransferase
VVDESARTWAASMPAAYEQWLVPAVFRPFALGLASRVAERSPRRVLELAAGTGVLTRELMRLPGATIVATDLNPPMVELGRQQAPGAQWRAADAMALPFEADTFDVVVCQFGVMFLPDKPAAYAEARRVLAPGGAFIFNTWSTLADHDFDAMVTAAAAEVLADDPPMFLAAVPHGYADAEQIVDDVRAGGFTDVVLETVRLEGHAGSAADVARGFCTGTPLRAELERRGDLERLTAAVSAAVESRAGAGPVRGHMTAHVVTATTDVSTGPAPAAR